MITENGKPEEDYINHLLEGKEFLSDEYYENIKKLKFI